MSGQTCVREHCCMATPRYLLVDPENEWDYHIASRCVRRAFLCGLDDLTGRDCSHRRGWLVDRIKRLAPCFAVDIYSYTVLSNHFHVVLRYDPLACREWSDDEVARRWYDAFPPTEHGLVDEDRKPEMRELMLGEPDRIARARRTLGSLSDFVKHLKQPIARRANLEDDCTGHFFEQRFYSGALLTEEALVAAMAYVDLNPVRAMLAERIEAIRETSIYDRLQENNAEALADYLRPVVSGLGPPSVGAVALSPSPASSGEPVSEKLVSPNLESIASTADGDAKAIAAGHSNDSRIHDLSAGHSEVTADGGAVEPSSRSRKRQRPAMTQGEYLDLVRAMVEAETAHEAGTPSRVRQWLARTRSLRKRQRAYGTEPALRKWIAERGMQSREIPLPA